MSSSVPRSAVNGGMLLVPEPARMRAIESVSRTNLTAGAPSSHSRYRCDSSHAPVAAMRWTLLRTSSTFHRLMRLWTLHPRHLDAAGLVALWREALLAQAVLLGRTRGYTRHPQLQRFRSAPDPLACI